ncbi:class I SAM-dependent methyltransferase [Xenorhabdus bovienii]|uniref:class I SAM-dependent methyltransferase n=1 Tax=Xenorhabdus bovienii TaxID=40576 RepID=UPI001EDFE611|nr:class I SAM-dependent methyltransferase [Xenorhabdus bovienii]MCG3460639.1 class I SAM-dependent methyltransferase [Xenorhabdus bovienii]
MVENFYDGKNIQFWDELAKIHFDKSDYNIDSYDPQKYKLKSIEISELGNLTGKKVLHLQCHIGLDSFAIEMLGANVTAIDYSSVAIDTAKCIKRKFGLKTKLYCANVYDLSSLNLGEFDFIFTSYGVIIWIQHLNLWAKTISSHLKSGGEFIIIDEHPFARMLSNPSQDNTSFNNSFISFHHLSGDPIKANYKYSYANRDVLLKNQEQYVYFHSLSEIITSLINEDMQLMKFKEFDKSFYKAFSQLFENEEGWWCFEHNTTSIPLMFLLRVKNIKNS